MATKKNTNNLSTAIASLLESNGDNYYLSKIKIDNITAELKDTYARTLKDGISVEDGKSIDNVKDNGFYHQVGDWSGTLPSTYSGDWHYSNLLAFNCGVDVTVQLLFHYKKSVFAIRTGRGESTIWQDWVVYNAPNDLENVIKAINNSISNLQSDVNSLKSDNTTNKSNISNLQSDVNSLKSDNTTNKSNISNLQSDVNSLKSDNTTNKGNISELQSQTIQNTTQLSSVSTTVNSHTMSINAINSNNQLINLANYYNKAPVYSNEWKETYFTFYRVSENLAFISLYFYSVGSSGYIAPNVLLYSKKSALPVVIPTYDVDVPCFSTNNDKQYCCRIKGSSSGELAGNIYVVSMGGEITVPAGTIFHISGLIPLNI